MNNDRRSLGGGFGMNKGRRDPQDSENTVLISEDSDFIETHSISDYLELREGDQEFEVFYLGERSCERALYMDLGAMKAERVGEFSDADYMDFLEKTFEYLEQDGEIENAFRALEEVNYHA